MEGDEGAKTEGKSQKETTANSSLEHWRPEVSCIPHHFHSYLWTNTINQEKYVLTKKNKAYIKPVNFHMSVLK